MKMNVIRIQISNPFKRFMAENGYETFTTFWEDFTIADRFGQAAVKDTFKRAFEEWRGKYKYLTELVLVLNHKIWQHYDENEPLAKVYDALWREAINWAEDNLKGEEYEYYFRITD